MFICLVLILKLMICFHSLKCIFTLNYSQHCNIIKDHIAKCLIQASGDICIDNDDMMYEQEIKIPDKKYIYIIMFHISPHVLFQKLS